MQSNEFFTKQTNSGGHKRKIFLIALVSLAISLLTVNAQNTASKQINLSLTNATLKELFNAIEQASNFRFLYDANDVNANARVTAIYTKTSIDRILREKLTDYVYEIKGNQIVVRSKQTSEVTIAQTPSKRITGVVTDAAGEPIPGASVMVKNTANGTVTDVSGNFILDNVPVATEDAVLVFSYIGYMAQEVQIGDQKEINIVLSEDTRQLDEVIVVAYGTVQRRNLIGAVDQISSRVIESRQVSNVSQALQGAASNLIIQQRSANPNDNQININIRGISSLNGNTPLIVVDGIILTESDLARLNPMDIDKVSVLKDAGSAAIYGSRAANGVILITTKQGKLNEKLSVQFNAMYGIQSPEFTYKPVHGYENAILRNIADYNVGNALSYTPEQIQYYKEQGDSKWFLKEILKNAPQQNYNLSVSGGSDKTTYMMSFGYFDQRSNFVGPDYGIKRYSVRNNLSTEIKRLKLSSIISFARTEGMDHSANRENTISDAYRIPLFSDLTMKSANGKYLLNNMMSQYNSLGMLEKSGKTESAYNNFVGNFDAEFKIMEGLKIKGNIGTYFLSYHRFIVRKPVDFYLEPDSPNPAYTVNSNSEVHDYNQNSLGFNSQLLLDFDRTFRNVHKVYGLLGYSNESLTRKSNQIGKEYTDPDLGIPNSDTVISSSSYNTPNGTDQSSIHSIFGRLGYAYNERYYAEAVFRYDGSSKFPSKNRWGFFPSISAAWRASDESFMEFYKNRVGDLKIRASYGILGNQNVGSYQYLDTYSYSTAGYALNNEPVSIAGYSLANPDLSWEKAKNFDLGLDMLFFKGKLSISLGYFNKITSDILLSPIVPSTFGSGLPSQNLGEVSNRGWETTVGFHAKTGEFTHQVSANMADSQNKLIKYGDTSISAVEEYYHIRQEGLPINSFYGYQRDGYFQTEEELAAGPFLTSVNSNSLGLGDVHYKDIDGDGFITPEKDRVVLGNAFPRYTFGFNYNLEWRGFDLGIFFQGVGKRTMGQRGEMVDVFHFNWCYTIFEHNLDYWTPDNRNARYPRLAAPGSVSNTNNYRQASDIYMFNAAYIRLKNATIGYTVPSNLLSRVGIERVRFYLTAENLITVSAIKFLDPEISSMDNNMSGGAGGARTYPTPRYFGCGIDFKF